MPSELSCHIFIEWQNLVKVGFQVEIRGRENSRQLESILPSKESSIDSIEVRSKSAKTIGIDGPPPRRSRHDGWTTARIEAFLEELRATASITDACQAVGMARSSAYKLYARADSGHIRKAWDEALRAATNVLVTTAFDRAVNGVCEQVWHNGRMVGFRERFDNRHLQFMLRARDLLSWATCRDGRATACFRKRPRPPTGRWRICGAVRKPGAGSFPAKAIAREELLPAPEQSLPEQSLPRFGKAAEPQSLPPRAR